VRSVSMGLWVNVGTRDEAPEDGGMCHLIEHMLFKGTRQRSAYQIAKEMDAIGGHSNAFTTMEHTCYHAKVLDTHLQNLVDILSDIFLHSLFDPVELERERAVILQEIGMLEDNPEEYLHLLAGASFFGDHPLGRSILGARETLERFDAGAIRQFFAKWYQPDHIVISAAGNLDHEGFLNLVRPHFETLSPGPPVPPRGRPTPRSTVSLHQRDLEQSHLCLGTPGINTTDSRRYAFSILNAVLGGNMSSRLFQEIRERRGLAYAVYSFTPSYADVGMLGVYAGVHPSNAAEAIALIVKELRCLKDEPLPEKEVENAKEYIKGCIFLGSESTDSQMLRVAQNEIHFGRYVPLSEVAQRLDKVTPAHIEELAHELFADRQVSLTMLGPVEDGVHLEEIIRI